MGAARRGARAAGAPAQRDPRRPLRAAAAARRRLAAAGARLRPSGLSPAVRTAITPPGGMLPASGRLRSRPRPRRRLARRRHAHPGAVGRRLRAREPRHHLRGCSPTRFAISASSMLASFFRTLQETLLAWSPSDGEAPHIVLLTPGPYNETYFEHAYLARYLGFTLVEGSDLTVRDDRVFLKTVTGLEPVHAILRRLDDDFCDPLELRTDSALGVPGLVQACRAGRVLVANALGIGVLESPALLAFLSGHLRAAARRAARACRRSRPGGAASGRARGRSPPISAAASSSRRFRRRRSSRCSSTARILTAVPRWAARLARRAGRLRASRSTCRCRTRPSWDGDHLESRGVDAARVPGGGRPRRLPRHAGRAGAHRRQRPAGRLEPARRRAARTRGCSRTRRSRASRCSAVRWATTTSSRARGSCRAARRSTSSGWDAMPSAARTARGCCVPCSPGCRTPTR